MKRDLSAAIIVSLVLHAALLGVIHLAVLPPGRQAVFSGAPADAAAEEAAAPIRVVMAGNAGGAAGGGGTAGLAGGSGAGSEGRRGPPEPLSDPPAALETARSASSGEAPRTGQAASADRSKPAHGEAAADHDEARADEEPANDTAAAGPPGRNRPSAETPALPETQAAHPPRLATSIEPEYPFRARRLGHEGAVTFTVLVGAGGAVLDITLDGSSGYAELDNAARAAVSHASYVPGSSGHPMPIRVRVIFELGSIASES